MNEIIFNIFISSIGFTLSLVAFLFLKSNLRSNKKNFGVKYLFLIFTIVKFVEIGNFIFDDNRIQEIFGVSYFVIAQIIANILMVLYPIANTNIILSILSTSNKKLKDKNRIILLLTVICLLVPVLSGGKGMKLFFLGLNLIIFPILIFNLKKNKRVLLKRKIYYTVYSFELFQLIAVIGITILHFINNDPFDPIINVVTGDFIRGNDIGIINGLIIINGVIWLRNSKLYSGELFIENSFLNLKLDNNWNIKDNKIKQEFILKYYQNSLQFENILNKIFRLEEQFINNEAQFNNIEEMSNLVGIKTTDLKNIFDTFNNDSFSKNLTKGKMMKAKNLIDNNYLKMNSTDDLLKLINYKSKSAFINNFKSTIGTTPVAYSKINKDL